MKALPPALPLGLLGLTLADEATAPAPALALPAGHRPALSAAPRPGDASGSTAAIAPR